MTKMSKVSIWCHENKAKDMIFMLKKIFSRLYILEECQIVDNINSKKLGINRRGDGKREVPGITITCVYVYIIHKIY